MFLCIDAEKQVDFSTEEKVFQLMGIIETNLDIHVRVLFLKLGNHGWNENGPSCCWNPKTNGAARSLTDICQFIFHPIFECFYS